MAKCVCKVYLEQIFGETIGNSIITLIEQSLH